MMILLALLASPAQAMAQYSLGLGVVIPLGRSDDRARVGVGLDGQYQVFDHPNSYYYDGPYQVASLGSATVHVTWTRPHVGASVMGAYGAMYPLFVGHTGFVPGFGLQAEAGLGISTDGSAGPVLGAVAVGPWSEARAEVTYWKGWHDPRLAVGAMVPVTGYLIYY